MVLIRFSLIRFSLIRITLVALMLISPPLWSQNSVESEVAMDAPQKLDDGPEATADKVTTDAESSDENQPATGDFKPSEEISEDFPVPLPSDI